MYSYATSWEPSTTRICSSRDAEAAGFAKGIAKGMKQGIQEGRDQGRQQGITQGESETKTEIGKRLKKRGFSTEEIHEITGLSREEVENL